MFGDYWVLWYAISNSYSIINSEFRLLLDSYLASDTQTEFSSTISNHSCNSDSSNLSETIHNYLKDCNTPYSLPNKSSDVLNISYRNISKHYLFGSKNIQIYYSSELVLKTVHPAIAHYSKTTTTETDVIFDIYLKNDNLYLFKNGELMSCVPKKEYHLLQGKFIMQLLCSLHNKTEQDWIGTLHGSTITDGNSSILFIGKSGKGKSTLSALLAINGFELLADDVSPLLSENQHIYYNPLSISIKEGAFNLLQPLVKNFEELPIVEFNKTKGQLKYMPCIKPKHDHYSCQAIVLVNYKPESDTIIEPISIKHILETIIEDSWLSPNPQHAQQFLDWLQKAKLLQLTYSDTNSVSSKISTLFKQFNHEN
ncbi:hypothetical protein SAMN04489796_1011176 [Winogradskyella thalassocola]|uniref:HprK-related kinase B n=2 Tax=Winogradskyella thalassocola TaxID=262004 RepID=A0A1G7YZ18_9FLAO|nr:hypothetical protein SAMN04489796_1011176 [Winogradskyella thalassocola]